MVLTSSGVILGSGSGSLTPLYVKLRDSTFVSIMMWLFPLLLRPPASLVRRFAAERTDSVSYRLRALSALMTRPSSRPLDQPSRPVAMSSPLACRLGSRVHFCFGFGQGAAEREVR